MKKQKAKTAGSRRPLRLPESETRSRSILFTRIIGGQDRCEGHEECGITILQQLPYNQRRSSTARDIKCDQQTNSEMLL
ncbi:unnamed protein product [Callosobruchus maculatus]|uniref:Uncharacterized protein n=1 Tax=Callosobruchus maculatus TaxID=64391 RepID=A0A653CC01_CALMS|nr:unnamed protein product [Callosobruchus maculatus]